MLSRARRRLASWIALMAIVAVTFMPTLVHLAASATDLADVCSADVVRGAGSDPGSSDSGRHVLDHCPYCALHADLALLPNPPLEGARRVARFDDLPVAFLQAPRANAVWYASQPRAPPQRA